MMILKRKRDIYYHLYVYSIKREREAYGQEALAGNGLGHSQVEVYQLCFRFGQFPTNHMLANKIDRHFDKLAAHEVEVVDH